MPEKVAHLILSPFYYYHADCLFQPSPIPGIPIALCLLFKYNLYDLIVSRFHIGEWRITLFYFSAGIQTELERA